MLGQSSWWSVPPEAQMGCLGVMKDGREALIGSTCATKYFKSDARFI